MGPAAGLLLGSGSVSRAVTGPVPLKLCVKSLLVGCCLHHLPLVGGGRTQNVFSLLFFSFFPCLFLIFLSFFLFFFSLLDLMGLGAGGLRILFGTLVGLGTTVFFCCARLCESRASKPPGGTRKDGRKELSHYQPRGLLAGSVGGHVGAMVQGSNPTAVQCSVNGRDFEAVARLPLLTGRSVYVIQCCV